MPRKKVQETPEADTLEIQEGSPGAVLPEENPDADNKAILDAMEKAREAAEAAGETKEQIAAAEQDGGSPAVDGQNGVGGSPAVQIQSGTDGSSSRADGQNGDGSSPAADGQNGDGGSPAADGQAGGGGSPAADGQAGNSGSPAADGQNGDGAPVVDIQTGQ